MRAKGYTISSFVCLHLDSGTENLSSSWKRDGVAVWQISHVGVVRRAVHMYCVSITRLFTSKIRRRNLENESTSTRKLHSDQIIECRIQCVANISYANRAPFLCFLFCVFFFIRSVFAILSKYLDMINGSSRPPIIKKKSIKKSVSPRVTYYPKSFYFPRN